MRQLKRFFNRILAFFGIRRRVRPEDMPRVLSAQALDQALSEARWLFATYQVEVRELQPGEEPAPPSPAGDFTLPDAKNNT